MMKENKLRILFDSNVVIDVFTNREGTGDSINSFLLMSKGAFDGYLVAEQITDIYYTLRKYIDNGEKRKDVIFKMLSLFNIIDLKKKELIGALDLKGNDYEDNLLISCAINNKIDYILTNDKRGFKNSLLNIITPKSLLLLLKN